MQDNFTNIDHAPCRQPLWSPDEIERLRGFADGIAYKPRLLAAFPGRTMPAIRIKLAMLRREMGLSKQVEADTLMREHDIMLDPDDPGLPDNWPHRWRCRAETSNNAFLAALQAAA